VKKLPTQAHNRHTSQRRRSGWLTCFLDTPLTTHDASVPKPICVECLSMIGKLSLKFGLASNSENLELHPSTMTVFIGANNAGKSLALRELTAYCEQGRRQGQKIIDTLEIRLPEIEDARSLFSRLAVPLRENESLSEGQLRVSRVVPGGRRADVQNVNWEAFSQQVPDWKEKQTSGTLNWREDVAVWFFQWYVSLTVLSLNGTRRLALSDELEKGDLLGPPANHLAALFIDDVARLRLRTIVHDAFGLFFVIDPTDANMLRVRLSEKPPTTPVEEQALDAQARAFHRQALEIKDFSDGVKAFCGVMAALISSEYRIILIDEPDAFLHPTLGRKLGKAMVRIASERDGNVFAATHSSAFLMGCMESGKPINVVRLTYDKPAATARVLPAADIRKLMTDPLLRSTKVLEALFYRGAVVTESDSDRALYDEINSRLDRDSDQYVRDSIFLNAYNKQTIRRIVKLLRGMGIPAAAVVDIDILKGNDLRHLMKACNVPRGIAVGIGQTKAATLQSLESACEDWEVQGIKCLSGADLETCESLLAQLRDYGIFVVPVGQLENWLTCIGAVPTKNKSSWLAQAFDLLGVDPDEIGYITPGEGDVWDFVRGIAKWTLKKDRKGILHQGGLA